MKQDSSEGEQSDRSYEGGKMVPPGGVPAGLEMAGTPASTSSYSRPSRRLWDG